ncbi:MAG: glycosyltransferase family 2 protein [Pseudomonadota bacterium]
MTTTEKKHLSGSSITIVIPAYNEEKTVSDVIKGVIAKVPHARILVIDDGSTDNTCQVAKDAGAEVVRHPNNKGNGACLKTALRSINDGIIGVLDADGQHDPGQLPDMLERLKDYDLVVGARNFAPQEGSPLRNLGNRILRKLASFLVERDIPDLTSGFRVFRHDIAIKFLHLYPNGYSFPSTSTLSFITAGYNVTFMPIAVSSRPAGTESKLRPFSDGFRFIMFILRIITMTNPNKIFLPAGLVMIFIGVLLTIRNLILFQQFSGGVVLFLAGGINIIFFGLILDQFALLRLQGRD